ncbi:MAG: hypothetical protein RIT14_1293, partial [Pseudomonadota bacterium]
REMAEQPEQNRPLAPVASPPRLVAIPRLAAGGRWRVEAMRAHSEPVLLWFTKGQGRITLAGVTRGYTAHNAVFIPAGTMYGFEVGPQVFGTAVFFGKETQIPLPSAPQLLRIREVNAQQELNVFLDMVLREMNSDAPAHDRATSLYLGLIGVWLERQTVKSLPDQIRPDATKRLVARFTELMEQEFRTGAGVGDMAAALGVTATHLSRCCRQACGRSAIDLLQDRRLFEARRLLSETDMPVGRIGESIGFTSAAYFTRAFQQMTGKSPTAFRRAS